MFKLRFFGGFATQRKNFLKATEFADLPIDSSLRKTIDQVVTSVSINDRPQKKINIWGSSIAAIKTLLIKSISANIVIALCSLVAVYSTQHIISHASDVSAMLVACGLVFVSEIFKHTLQYFDGLWRSQSARGIQFHLFTMVNKKLVAVDPNAYGEFTTGNLKTLVASDIESVEDFITAASNNWIPTVILLIVLTPVIYSMTGTLGLVGLGIGMLQVPISIIFARFIERYQSRMQASQDNLTTLVGEWVKNIRLVRYLGWQAAFERDISDGVRLFTIQGARHHFLVIITFAISFTWWMFPIAGMFVVARYWEKSFDLVPLFSSIWALSYIMNHIQHVPYAISLYGSAAAGVKRISKFLSLPELRAKLQAGGEHTSLKDKPVRIHFKNVGLKLADKAIFENFNAVFKLRNKTAIVGSVGSGKSLLLELLAGERAPTTGSIEIEFASGISAPLWTEAVYDSYREHLALVPQLAFLSNTSIKNNISLDDGAALENVIEAAKKSQLIQDIEGFPKQYEEEVGETGINLSGGQKQRISMARAFFSKRPIFVLDDPLSAVDRKTEKKLFGEIESNCEGFVLVSHRLDELSRCERVIVLEGGRIIEDDSPDVLLKSSQSAFVKFIEASKKSEKEAA